VILVGENNLVVRGGTSAAVGQPAACPAEAALGLGAKILLLRSVSYRPWSPPFDLLEHALKARWDDDLNRRPARDTRAT
jgi:hypothetical protein